MWPSSKAMICDCDRWATVGWYAADLTAVLWGNTYMHGIKKRAMIFLKWACTVRLPLNIIENWNVMQQRRKAGAPGAWPWRKIGGPRRHFLDVAAQWIVGSCWTGCARLRLLLFRLPRCSGLAGSRNEALCNHFARMRNVQSRFRWPALVARFDQRNFCKTSLIETPNINLEYHQYTLGACDDLAFFSRLAIVRARNLECVCVWILLLKYQSSLKYVYVLTYYVTAFKLAKLIYLTENAVTESFLFHVLVFQDSLLR